MNIFIVGASGLVGSHIFDLLKKNGFNCVGSHLSFPTPETIFFNPNEVNIDLFLDSINFKPDIIINCAALTNVDYCEENNEESFLKTVESNRILVEYCQKKSIKFIYISTDYVFDGKNGPYKENDTPSPINIYGEHKLKCELLTKQLENFLILRVTNVYGEEIRSKNFISNIVKKIYSGEEIKMKLPCDQFATPVFAGDIAKIIFILIVNGKVGYYNIASTDYIDRFHLGLLIKKNIAYPNDRLHLIPIFTKDSSQIAKRPLYGGLLNIKISQEFPEFEFTTVCSFLNKK